MQLHRYIFCPQTTLWTGHHLSFFGSLRHSIILMKTKAHPIKAVFIPILTHLCQIWAVFKVQERKNNLKWDVSDGHKKIQSSMIKNETIWVIVEAHTSPPAHQAAWNSYSLITSPGFQSTRQHLEPSLKDNLPLKQEESHTDARWREWLRSFYLMTLLSLRTNTQSPSQFPCDTTGYQWIIKRWW